MTQTDALARLLLPDIRDRDILEVACGTADFALSASSYARSATCIDLDDHRLNPSVRESNICFQIMDAAGMSFPDDTFDSVFIYNAFYHIQAQWTDIEAECLRVLKKGGALHLIGTWKLDTGLIHDAFAASARWNGKFLMVRIEQ